MKELRSYEDYTPGVQGGWNVIVDNKSTENAVSAFSGWNPKKVQNLLRNDMNSVYENVAKQFVNMTYTGIGNSDTFDLVISKLVVPSW